MYVQKEIYGSGRERSGKRRVRVSVKCGRRFLCSGAVVDLECLQQWISCVLTGVSGLSRAAGVANTSRERTRSVSVFCHFGSMLRQSSHTILCEQVFSHCVLDSRLGSSVDGVRRGVRKSDTRQSYSVVTKFAWCNRELLHLHLFLIELRDRQDRCGKREPRQLRQWALHYSSFRQQFASPPQTPFPASATPPTPFWNDTEHDDATLGHDGADFTASTSARSPPGLGCQIACSTAELFF